MLKSFCLIVYGSNKHVISSDIKKYMSETFKMAPSITKNYDETIKEISNKKNVVIFESENLDDHHEIAHNIEKISQDTYERRCFRTSIVPQRLIAPCCIRLQMKPLVPKRNVLSFLKFQARKEAYIDQVRL